MKRSRRSKVVILGMALSLASAAQGFVQQKEHSHAMKNGSPLGHHVVRPALTGAIGAAKAGAASFGADAQVKVDVKSKAVRVITDPSVALLKNNDQASLEKACLGFVADHQEFFGRVSAKDLELNQGAVLLTKDMQFLKYRVYHKGILVQDANIDCRFKFGKLVQVINMSFSEATVDTGAPQKGLQNIVKDAIGVDQTENQGQVYRVIADKDSYRLVLTDIFRVNKAGEPYDVQVMSNSGEIFEQRPLHHYIDGKVEAQFFDRWWQEDLLDINVGQATIETTDGNVMSDMTGRFTANAGSSPSLNGFRGPQVNVRATTGELSVVDAVLSDDLYAIQQLRETSGEMFEGPQTSQAMIFHHTNKIINRARLYLNNNWFESPLVANANLARNCNAHWDGSTINFYSAGSECANTGLISDVVYHEWGHGLDHNTGGIDDGAFSEGFGDIMSLVFTHSNILGIGFRTDGSEVRNLEPNKVYPEDARGGVHAEGQIIGSTFFDLWEALLAEHGMEVADELLARYAFNVIVAATRYTDVYEALKVIDDNDGFLGNGTPNLCLINEVFQAHGLAEEDAACLMGELDADVAEVNGNNNGVIEPGEQISIDVALINSTGVDQVAVTGTATLGMAVEGVTITQGALNFGDVAAGATANSSTLVMVDVADNTTCGASFDIVYGVSSTEREADFKKTYQVGKKIIGEQVMSSATNLPIDITDNNTVSTGIMFDSSDWNEFTPVHAARLRFEITHTYVGDLTVALESPAGDVYEVYRGSGSGDDVSFDEDVSAIVSGAKGKGEWKLNVTDSANADVGTLDMADLALTPARYECM